ncbi:MAG: SAM-dependent methyltransferase [Gammaproteobacteria bacterium]
MEHEPQGQEFVAGEVFDEEYEYFYANRLGAERSEREARLIERLAELRRGERVLDLPCGDGRISVQLARASGNVVGVDRSERLIARAERRGATGARFEVGVMRALRWQAEFDCIVIWFGSFGYFDTHTNRRVLAVFWEALRPGGRLIIDQINPAQVRRDVEGGRGAAVQLIDRGLDLMVDRVTVGDDCRAHTERFLVRDGRVRKLEFSLELVADDKLERCLRDAGFDRVSFSDQHGGPYRAEGRRRITVAHRLPT